MFLQRSLFSILIACAVSQVLWACKSSTPEGPQRTVQATNSMTALAADANKLKGSSSAAIGSLAALSDKPTADAKAQFATFSKDVTAFEQNLQSYNSRHESMKTDVNSYFAKWQQDLSTISDKEIREQGEERRTDAIKEFEKVGSNATAVKQHAEPLLAVLKDAQKYLSNDLSPAGIASAKDIVKRAGSMNSDLEESVDELTKELDYLAKKLAPATAPPAVK